MAPETVPNHVAGRRHRLPAITATIIAATLGRRRKIIRIIPIINVRNLILFGGGILFRPRQFRLGGDKQRRLGAVTEVVIRRNAHQTGRPQQVRTVR